MPYIGSQLVPSFDTSQRVCTVMVDVVTRVSTIAASESHSMFHCGPAQLMTRPAA
jgi:hypothetical protein